MPGGDRTGPCGLGAKTGRAWGDCNSASVSILMLMARFALANWKIILGFLVTLTISSKAGKLSDKLLQSRATRILLPDKSGR